MIYTKEKVKKRIARAEDRISFLKMKHGNTPSLTHTYHGGWDLGYWQGRLSVLEEILDDLEENQCALN